MKKSLNNKSLSLLSTATWRVFEKSIYKRKQMRIENWEKKNKKQKQNNNLQKNKYTYDTAFFFNCNSERMCIKSESSLSSPPILGGVAKGRGGKWKKIIFRQTTPSLRETPP
jgi:hypothetical protein